VHARVRVRMCACVCVCTVEHRQAQYSCAYMILCTPWEYVVFRVTVTCICALSWLLVLWGQTPSTVSPAKTAPSSLREEIVLPPMEESSATVPVVAAAATAGPVVPAVVTATAPAGTSDVHTTVTGVTA
jgi:hypothetical protein